MVTASTKKLRDWIAIALLAYVGLRLVLAFIALLTADGAFGFGFAEKSYLVVGSFTSVTPILLVGGAVLLVTHLGEPSKQARVLTIVALAELGVMLLLGLVTWIAALTTDDGSQLGTLGGVPLGGKAVGSIDTVLGFALIGLALYFCLVTFNALPKPVRQAPAWGGQPGGHPGGQPGWGPPPSQQQGPQGWGAQQQLPQQPWGQPDRGQAPSAPQGWGSPDPWAQQQAPDRVPDQPSGQPSAQPSPWEREPQPVQEATYEAHEPASSSPATPGADAGQQSSWGRSDEPATSWSEPAGAWGQPTWGEPVQSQEYGTPRPADPEPPAQSGWQSESESRSGWQQPEAQPEVQSGWPQPEAQPEVQSGWQQPEPQPEAQTGWPQPDAQDQPAWPSELQQPPADQPTEQPIDQTAQFAAVPAVDDPAADQPTADDQESDRSVTDPSEDAADHAAEGTRDGRGDDGHDDTQSSGWWNPGQR